MCVQYSFKARKTEYFTGFFVENTIIGNEVQFVDIIIEKDAAAYIKKHSKDNSVTLYVCAAGGG
ncbi:MAG: hypothetical protein APF77_05065 [Clostridia bacterium BRH_c25]|nr:MAG: hypothetical protein APF77_05065 [Clostridia bacterium BRH_c25]